MKWTPVILLIETLHILGVIFKTYATQEERVYPVYALYFSHTKYSITPKRETWRNSQLLCKQRNARLIELNSEAEYDTIIDFIKQSGVDSGKRFWIGIHYLESKTYWGTHTGNAARFTKWTVGEPKLFEDNETRECVMLWNPSKNRTGPLEWLFTMSTEFCQEEMFSICETTLGD